MNDWFRSLSVLGIAFVGVAALTFGLAALIVPGAAGSARASGLPTPDASGQVPLPADGPITAVGGVLAVTGDREGSFVLDREVAGQRYELRGAAGKVFFDGNPLGVAQISYDGLELYLDPPDCTLTPGERHDPTGVAGATIRCEDLEDVRGGGVISLVGTVGIAANLLGLRGGLPESGGNVSIGDVEVTFELAAMTIPSGAQFSGVFAGSLHDPDTEVTLQFTYDPGHHQLVLSEIFHEGTRIEVPAADCTVTTEEIGLLSPSTRVVDMRLRCAAVEVTTLGTVPIDGSLIVELSEPPS